MDRIQIVGDQIHIGVQETLPPVNFASCWNTRDQPEDFLSYVDGSTLPGLLPPILFREVAGCWHLRLDLWRNDRWTPTPQKISVASR